jgi:Holliday junction resolvase RusA-like endonuclease
MVGRPPLTGPLMLEAEFRFPRPMSHWRSGSFAGDLKRSAPTYCKTRPDLDKLLRAVGDAITGIVCVDDAQLGEINAVKVYGVPGLDVFVCELAP